MGVDIRTSCHPGSTCARDCYSWAKPPDLSESSIAHGLFLHLVRESDAWRAVLFDSGRPRYDGRLPWKAGTANGPSPLRRARDPHREAHRLLLGGAARLGDGESARRVRGVWRQLLDRDHAGPPAAEVAELPSHPDRDLPQHGRVAGPALRRSRPRRPEGRRGGLSRFPGVPQLPETRSPGLSGPPESVSGAPKVFPDLRKACRMLRKPFRDLRKAFRTLRKPFRDLRKAFRMLRKPFRDLRKAFRMLRKSFPDLRKAFRTLRKSFRTFGKRFGRSGSLSGPPEVFRGLRKPCRTSGKRF